MLDLAYKHEEEIKNLMYNTWYDEKYMFYHCSSYNSPFSCPDADEGDWNVRQFASLNHENKVIGYISYKVDRVHDYVHSFGAINFSDNKITFGRDLVKVIDDIFCKFNIRKLEFFVVVGNPIEKTYDKMITKYGGNIVGIKHKNKKLLDNQYYDEKMYEIFREDYITAKEKLRHGK